MLQSLPKTLRTLDVSENQLEGSLRFSNSPPFIESLILDRNKFHGGFAIYNPPDTLRHLTVSSNQLRGTVVVGSPLYYVCFAENTIDGVVNENGLPHENSEAMFS